MNTVLLSKSISANRMQSIQSSKITKERELNSLSFVKNIPKVNQIQQTRKVSSIEIYTNHYELNISKEGIKKLNQQNPNDSYTVINPNVFSYTKDLRIIYKGY